MKNKAECLAKFIANNWHWCPIDGNIDVPNCEGWRCDIEHCAKCIIKNIDHMETGEDND